MFIRVLRLGLDNFAFGKLRTASEIIFGNDRVIFKNPSTPRIKISCLYLRKSGQVYKERYGSVEGNDIFAESILVLLILVQFENKRLSLLNTCYLLKIK